MEIMTNWPTNQPTDRHDRRPWGFIGKLHFELHFQKAKKSLISIIMQKNVSFISYNVQAWIKAFLLREFLFEVGTNKGWRCVEVMDVTMRVAMIWGCVIRGGVIFCGTHYEIDPPPPSQIGSCETIPFLLGEIFSLNPMIWKIIDQIQNCNFSNYPSKMIERLYRESICPPILDNSPAIQLHHTRQKKWCLEKFSLGEGGGGG